jgi:hypothetical protein
MQVGTISTRYLDCKQLGLEGVEEHHKRRIHDNTNTTTSIPYPKLVNLDLFVYKLT